MENFQQKSPKIKVFQLVQKHFATIGICSNLAEQPYPINTKIIKGSATLILFIICSLIYLSYEAKTISENMRIIYMCSSATLIFLALMILTLNVKELFQVVNDFDSIANTSECSVANPIHFVLFPICI